jgi:hypothetical protein
MIEALWYCNLCLSVLKRLYCNFLAILVSLSLINYSLAFHSFSFCYEFNYLMCLEKRCHHVMFEGTIMLWNYAMD